MTAGRAMAAAAVPVLAALGVVSVIGAEGLSLVMLAGAAVIAAGVAAALPVLRVERRLDDRRVARFIEERSRTLSGDRALDDALVSALDGASGTRSGPRFCRCSSRTACAGCARSIRREIVSPESIRRAAGWAAAGAAALAVALVVSAPDVQPRARNGAAAVLSRIRSRRSAARERARAGRNAAAHPDDAARIGRNAEALHAVGHRGRRRRAADRADDGRRGCLPARDPVGRSDVHLHRHRGVGPLRGLHRHGAVPAARRAHRSALRVSVVRGACAARRSRMAATSTRRPARACGSASTPTSRSRRGRLRSARHPPCPLRAVAPRTVEADLVLARDDSYRVRLVRSRRPALRRGHANTSSG